MGNDLHARVQTLARLRRGRIGVSDRWDSSGGTARDNYLTCYPAPAALLDSHQFRFILRARRKRPCHRRAVPPFSRYDCNFAECKLSRDDSVPLRIGGASKFRHFCVHFRALRVLLRVPAWRVPETPPGDALSSAMF